VRHLINTRDFTVEEIDALYERATLFLDEKPRDILHNKTVITIFFENSTRTRSSFEIAAKRLGAMVVSLDVSKSSSSKGETLFDTAANLDAMSPDASTEAMALTRIPHKPCWIYLPSSVILAMLRVKKWPLWATLKIRAWPIAISSFWAALGWK